MNILLAIPARGQNKYLHAMVGAIDALSVKPYKVLYMADRPSKEERVEAMRAIGNHPLIEYFPVTKYPDYVGRPHMTAGVDWFLTGHVRNNAVAYMDNHPEIDAVVFIDGDCIPERDLVAGHSEILGQEGLVVSVGKRKESIYGWDDQRCKEAEINTDIFHDVPCEVTSEELFVDSGVVWTCNFGMNRNAIDALRKLNNTLYGRNETFSSDFLGTWGGEDGFIGLECFYTGIPVFALANGDNGIRHQFHERSDSKYNHVAFLYFLEEQRERLLYLLDRYGLNSRHIKFVPREELLSDASG